MLSPVLRRVAAPLLALALAMPLAAQADTPAPPADTAAADSPATAVSDTAAADSPAASAPATGLAPLVRDSAEQAAFDSALAAAVAARGNAGLPAPWQGALLLAMLFGALGGLAGDIVSDGGRLDHFRRADDKKGWLIGWRGSLLVGAVAALILCGLRPPGDSWAELIGTAAAVGVGSEAFLKAIIASFQTREVRGQMELLAASSVHINRAAHTPAPGQAGGEGSGAGGAADEITLKSALGRNPAPRSTAATGSAAAEVVDEGIRDLAARLGIDLRKA